MHIKDRLKNYPIHPSMRGQFGYELYKQMAKNENIWLIVGDLGYKLFDYHFEDFPERTINTGASEMAMLDIAVGLSLSGKIPVVYSITPFLLYRPFETWRTYIDKEKIHVIGIGSGRDSDYAHDGYSHYAGDDKLFMQHFKNVKSYWPMNTEIMKRTLDSAIKHKDPTYINLER